MIKDSSESRYAYSSKKKEEKSTSKNLCNSCKAELPKQLDRGICPTCGRRN